MITNLLERAFPTCADTSPAGRKTGGSEPVCAPSVAPQGILTLLLAALLIAPTAGAQSYQVNWHTIAGGGQSANGGQTVKGSIGQLSSASMTGGGFSVQGGFNSVPRTPASPPVTGGTLEFRTAPDPNGPFVFDTDGSTRLNDGFLAQIYAGPDANNLAPYGPVASFGVFQGSPNPGLNGFIFDGSIVNVPSVPEGGQGVYRIRAWLAPFASYEAAIAAGAKSGESEIVSVTFGGGANPPAAVDGFQSFSLSIPPPPAFDIAASDADKNEGNSGDTPFLFTVNRCSSAGAASVSYAVTPSGSHPAEANDFNHGGVYPTGIVHFADGESSQQFTLNVVGDSGVEEHQDFTVNLHTPSAGMNINTATATGTIRNDDVAQTESIIDNFANARGQRTIVPPGNAMAQSFKAPSNQYTRITEFTLPLARESNISNGRVTIELRSDILPGADLAIGGLGESIPGDTVLASWTDIEIVGHVQPTYTNLTLTLTNDVTLYPGSRYWIVVKTLQNSDDMVWSSTASMTSSGIGTIDTPAKIMGFITVNQAWVTALPESYKHLVVKGIAIPPPPATIGVTALVSVLEEDQGGSFQFHFLRRGGDIGTPVQVGYRLVGSGSHPTEPSDVDITDPLFGNLTLMGNADSHVARVQTINDSLVEANETFRIEITNATGATITSASAEGLILDDDFATLSLVPAAPNASFSGVNEGDSGVTNAFFQIQLSQQLDVPVTVRIETVDGSATVADQDYAATNVTFTIPASTDLTPGNVNTSFQVHPDIFGDTKIEPSEFFGLNVTGIDAEGRGVLAQSESVSSLPGSIVSLFQVFPVKVAAHGKHFWVTEFGGSLTAYTVTNVGPAISGIVAVGSYTTPSGLFPTSLNLHWRDNHLYWAQSNLVSILNVSDPARPTLVTQIQEPGLAPSDVKPDGNRLYVGSVIEPKLVIYDISTPQSPVRLGAGVPGPASFDQPQVEIRNGLAYLAIGKTLEIHDVSDPAAISKLGSLTLPDTAYDIALHGQRLFLPGQQGMSIVDISDPASPTRLNIFLSVSNAVNQLEIQGDLLYATTAKSVDIYDLSDPASIKLLSRFGVNAIGAGQPYALAVGSDRVFFGQPSSVTGALKPFKTQVGIFGDDVQYDITANRLDQPENISASNTNHSFTVTRSGSNSSQFDQVEYQVYPSGPNPASANDFGGSFPSGTVPFHSGDTATVQIFVSNDSITEANEGFIVVLTNAVNAVIGVGSASGVIRNDDAMTIGLSRFDTPFQEGNSGTNLISTSFQINGTADVPVSFQAATVDGTATAADHDYTPYSGTLTIPAGGQLFTNLPIGIVGDTTFETDERFQLTLSNLQAAGRRVALERSQPEAIASMSGFFGQSAIALHNSLVLAATSEQLNVIDVSNPAQPTILGGVTNAFGGAAQADVAVVAGHVAYADGRTLRIVDLTNPALPIAGTAIPGVSNVSHIAVSGSLAAVGGNGGIYLVDFTPAPAVVLESYITPSTNGFEMAHALQFFSNHLYASIGGSTLRVFDLATVVAPQAVGQVTLNEPATDMVMHGDRLLVLGNGGLTSFDLSSPASPRLISRLNQGGAGGNALSIVGDLAYIGSGSGLAIYDLSDEFAPAPLLSGSPGNSSGFNDLLIDGNHIFGVSSSSGFHVSRLESQSSQTIVIQNDDIGSSLVTIQATAADTNENHGTFQFEVSRSGPLDASISLNYMVVASGNHPASDSDFTATNGTIQFSPQESSRTLTVAVVGDDTVELDEDFEVRLSPGSGNIQLTQDRAVGVIRNDDAAFVHLERLNGDPPGTDGIREGDFGSTNATFVVALSNPVDAPVQVHLSTTDGTATIANMDYQPLNDHVVTIPANTRSEFANPAAAVKLDVFVTGDTNIEPRETFCVEINGLQAAGRNVQLGFNPQVPGTLTEAIHATPGIAQDVVASGDLAFVADGFNGLVVYGVTNRPSLQTVELGAYNTDIQVSRNLDVVGNRVYLTDANNGVRILDANGGNPTLLGTIDTLTHVTRDVTVVGNLAYLAVEHNNGLRIVDVSDPQSPVQIGQATLDSNFNWAVAVEGQRAYLASDIHGITVVDISNPASPTVLGSYDTAGFARGLAVSGSRLFVGDGSNGLLILDVSDPTTITELARYTAPDGVAGKIFLRDAVAYVAFGAAGLHMLDVADPAQPKLLRHFPTPGPRGVFANDRGIYVAEGTDFHFYTSPNKATVTILPDETRFDLAGGNLDAPENAVELGTNLNFIVTRTGQLDQPTASVGYYLVGHGQTPADNLDLIDLGTTNTIHFNIGEASRTVTVNIHNDMNSEPDEGFRVFLANPVGGVLGTDSAAGLIRNDDGMPALLSLTPIELDRPEGNQGTTPFTFRITRSGNTALSVSALASVAGSGANPIDGNDGTGAGAPIALLPGETVVTNTLFFNGDTDVEPDETFTVTLTDLVNATLDPGAQSLTGTIRNDDGLPPATRPTLEILSIDFDDVVLRVHGDPGTPFLLDRSTNLVHWIQAHQSTIGVHGHISILDDHALTNRMFFYRARVTR